MNPLLEILDKAGFVGPVLVVCSLMMWWAMGWRFYLLRGPATATANQLIDGGASGTLLGEAVRTMVEASRGRGELAKAFAETAARPFREAFGSQANMVRSVVAIAPLAGLLGTVTGMIETFDSLGSMQLVGRNGGIGAGIGEAMISTQMGLVVAVPGLLIGAMLERKQGQLDDALDAVVDRISQDGGRA